MSKSIPIEKIEEAKALYKELLVKKDAYINEDSVYLAQNVFLDIGGTYLFGIGDSEYDSVSIKNEQTMLDVAIGVKAFFKP